MSIPLSILSVVVTAVVAFIAGAKWQQRRNTGQLNKLIGELKASADALEKSVKQNQQ